MEVCHNPIFPWIWNPGMMQLLSGIPEVMILNNWNHFLRKKFLAGRGVGKVVH